MYSHVYISHTNNTQNLVRTIYQDLNPNHELFNFERWVDIISQLYYLCEPRQLTLCLDCQASILLFWHSETCQFDASWILWLQSVSLVRRIPLLQKQLLVWCFLTAVAADQNVRTLDGCNTFWRCSCCISCLWLVMELCGLANNFSSPIRAHIIGFPL